MEAAAACLGEALDVVDIDRFDADQLRRGVDALRNAQAVIESGLTRIGLRADALAEGGAAPPAADTLLGSGRVRGSTARREARRMRLARRSPDLGSALRSGRLGGDHLDALVRYLEPLDDALLTRLDLAGLAEEAERLPADTFAGAVRRAVDTARLAAEADSDAEADAASEPPADAVGTGDAWLAGSELRHWFDHRTGFGHLTAQLDPERYEAVVTALDQHTAALAARAEASTPRDRHLAAEALVDLVCSSGERSRHLPHIHVVVDEDTLAAGRHDDTIAQTGDGHPLSDEAIARLCCDSVLRRVTLDPGGVPIDVGRRHRTATDAQWSAIRALHSSCAWQHCDRPLSHCQLHHIAFWRHGGRTDLDNLVPLCGHHHHLVHEGRWRIELLPDRALRLTRPDGQPHGLTPTPTRRPPPLGQPRTLTTSSAAGPRSQAA